MISDSLIKACRSLCQEVATPFYLINLDQIKKTFLAFEENWRREFPLLKVAYSYKTNSLKAITQLLRQLNCAAEVVSGSELSWAIQDGFLPENIFFDGPVKKKAELEKALYYGVNVQVDSIDELSLLISLYSNMKSKSKISLRLSGEYKQGGKSRFGLLPDEFWDAYKKLSEASIPLAGIHIHLGSNINDPEIYARNLDEYTEILVFFYKINPSQMWLDVGGGFPAHSIHREQVPTLIELFAKRIRLALTQRGIDCNKVRMIVEPGRCIVEDHGYLISKICVQKQRNGRNLLIVDAGIHQIRSIQSWYHPVLQLTRSEEGEKLTYAVYGSNCFESDLLIPEIQFSKNSVKVGDCIVIGSAGGYDIPSTNLWTRPLPAIYGILNDNFYLLRSLPADEEIRSLQDDFCDLSNQSILYGKGGTIVV